MKAPRSVTVRVCMPEDLKLAFFEHAEQGGRKPSVLLREFAASCVGWNPLPKGIVGRPSSQELVVFRIERKLDYLIATGLSASALALQREIAIQLSREVPLELASVGLGSLAIRLTTGKGGTDDYQP